MSGLDRKVCWCVNKASIVVSLSDHVRWGRPGLCQGAEEQVQDQTLLCQTPTHGLPACPDDPGGRQHGNVRQRAHKWERLGRAETCSDLRLKLVSWLVVDSLPVCSCVSLLPLMLGLWPRVESHAKVANSFVMVLYLHLCVETKCMHTTGMRMSHSSI